MSTVLPYTDCSFAMASLACFASSAAAWQPYMHGWREAENQCMPDGLGAAADADLCCCFILTAVRFRIVTDVII